MRLIIDFLTHAGPCLVPVQGRRMRDFDTCFAKALTDWFRERRGHSHPELGAVMTFSLLPYAADAAFQGAGEMGHAYAVRPFSGADMLGERCSACL